MFWMVGGSLEFVLFCIVLGGFFEGVNHRKHVLDPKMNLDVDYVSLWPILLHLILHKYNVAWIVFHSVTLLFNIAIGTPVTHYKVEEWMPWYLWQKNSSCCWILLFLK